MAAYAALVSLMHIIDDLRLHPRPPISLRKKQAESLIAKITSLQEFVEGYNPHLNYNAEADPLEIRIADAAHAAEDVIESHIVNNITNNGKKITSVGLYEGLKMVIQEMALIEKEAKEIKQTTSTSVVPPDSSMSSSSSSSTAHKSSSITMVGADDALHQMKDKLTSHRRDLQIIPIVGMGGTGKTTLAINIYQHRLIKERFDICAWATISQEYSIREILAQVLSHLNSEKVGEDLSEHELGDKLYKHLYGRRYMIVMDDMWTIEAWDGVRSFLPDNENGSRIVVTTRLSNLGSVLSNSNNLEMKLLDEASSWDLLSKTVFGEESCPVELEEIGREIGKCCKGLPLSIVVVGGLLAKSEHTKEFWEYIAKNLSRIVNSEDDERCLRILHLSYKQLPVYLKPCFLYMGVYPEDEVIRISKLINLWVAEGFLKPISGKSLEEIARVYLKELADRNLILIDKMGISGNIKCCKIHDLLRDLCLREAQKERFYTVVTGQTTPQGIVSGQRRVVISSTTSYNVAINALSSMSLVRSLKWDLHAQVELPLSCRLLRILDSSRCRFTGDAEFLANMHQLVNSRFLAISSPSSGCIFPCSIWPFWNLQTLIVVDVHPEVSAQTIIWYMPQIRHVDIRMLDLRDPSKYDIVLGNLQSLRTLKNFKCSKQVVKRIPNIKKLKMSYYERVDDDRYCLTNLDYLYKLESLHCDFFKRTNRRLHSRIKFPHSLKKLVLFINKSQCWEGILGKIGVLPLLQKLILVSGRFKEGQWETTEGQFRSLKYLAVHCCAGLHVWKTESSHFPCLEHLRFSDINQLKEIPLDFAEISTLQVMDIGWCSNSVVVSAKRIVEEQEELYGEEAALQVQVNLDMKNEALESLASPNFRVTC